MRRLLSLPSALPRCRSCPTTLARSSITGTHGRHFGSLPEHRHELNATEQPKGPEELLAVLGRLGRQGLHAQLLWEVDRAQQAGAMDRRHYNAAVSSHLEPPPQPNLQPDPHSPPPPLQIRGLVSLGAPHEEALRLLQRMGQDREAEFLFTEIIEPEKQPFIDAVTPLLKEQGEALGVADEVNYLLESGSKF